MTKDDVVFVERQETEKAVRPAKRWRNRYWVPEGSHLTRHDGSLFYGPGETCGSRIYASRDLAETGGERNERNARFGLKFVAAFPITDGEA